MSACPRLHFLAALLAACALGAFPSEGLSAPEREGVSASSHSARASISRVGPADALADVRLPGSAAAKPAPVPAAPAQAETAQAPTEQPVVPATPSLPEPVKTTPQFEKEQKPEPVATQQAAATSKDKAGDKPGDKRKDGRKAEPAKPPVQSAGQSAAQPAAEARTERAEAPDPQPQVAADKKSAPESRSADAPKAAEAPKAVEAQKAADSQKATAEQKAAPAPVPQSSQPAQATAENKAEAANGTEKPKPTPAQLRKENFRAAKKAMVNNEFYGPAKVFTVLRDDPELEPEMREEVLYSLADALFNLHKLEIKEHYALLVDAYQEAMQANPRSTRTPGALFFLGLINLKAGNVPEAKGFFTALRAKWPKDPNVPAINYFFGEHFYALGQYQEASEEYRHVVDVYPEHGLARDASVNLALTYNQLGEFEKAFQIIEYMEKRWPRFYLEHPPFLRMLGDGAFRMGQWERAKGHYLTYVNLVPLSQDSILTLTRVADAFAKLGAKAAAREIYERAVAAADLAAKSPVGANASGGNQSQAIRDAALIARMRLAEEGVHDSPALEEMFQIFDRPYNARPAEIYAEILRERQGAPLGIMALLKLAMWQLHQGQQVEALRSVQKFLTDHPSDPMAPRARDVGLRAFAEAVARATEEGHHARVQELFKTYPFLSEGQSGLPIEVRLAVAQAAWKAGEPKRALGLLEDFLKPDQGRAMEMALDLAFAIHVDGQRWREVVELGEKAKEWKVNEERMRQMTYAMALSYENLADSESARPLWAKLFQDRKLGNSQRSYAMYFMARAAFEKGDMDKTNVWGQEALSMFLLEGQDQTRVKDCLRLLIESTARGKHWKNALGWALELEKHMRPEDVEWDAARYRRAEIHKALGETKEWRAILTELAKKDAKSLTGRLATAALNSEAIETSAKKYSQ